MPWPRPLQVLVLLGCVVIATPLFSCHRSGKPVDVIVAFSDSRSTMWQWWTGVLFNPAVSNFVNSLLAHLDYTQYSVAVMAFSNTARIIAPFSNSLLELQRSLVYFRPEFGTCNMLQAVSKAQSYFRSDGRPEAARVVVVVADTPSGDNFQLGLLSERAYKEDRIQFVGVGYRNFFIRPQLEALTGDPRAVFFADQDFGLWLMIRFILNAICDLLQWPTEAPPTTAAPLSPTSQIVLVVDDSESTRRFRGLDFFLAPGVRDFLSAFTQDLNAASCPTGLLLFSDSTRQLCPLTSNTTRLQGCVRSVSDNLEFGGSATSEGLRSARSLLTSQGDPDSKKYVIVLTDGCSENSVATAAESQRLVDMNVEVMAVGYPNPTGASQVQGELETIAGDAGRVYRVASDSDLPALVGELYRRVCPPSSV